MVQLVSVEPTDDGWAVRSAVLDQELRFSSGARAEAAARGLGESLAMTGEAAEIQIHLRGGALAGRFLIPCCDSPFAPAG